MSKRKGRIATDTSVFLRFLHIGRMDLLGGYPGKFVSTNVVAGEITYPKQQDAYRRALDSKLIGEVQLKRGDQLEKMDKLAKATGLDPGEVSVIVAGIEHNWPVATQDSRAIDHLCEMGIRVITVPDIIVALLKNGTLTMRKADGYLEEWATKHSFVLKIRSFRDLLG